MWYRWLIYPVLFILSAFLLTVFPNADVFAQCLTGDRAEGLISTPVSINKFGNPASLCIIDPRATFATYEIPTYTDFISTYYQLPKALPENLQHGFRYVNSYTPAGGSADESYFNGGTGRITGNSVYHINGNLTLYSNLTIPAKSTIIIFVEQDLLINSNIDYDDNSGGIIFIVRGNININYLVSRVNAVLISAGAHNGAVQTDYSICTGFDGTCPQLFRRGTSALTINGTMASICSDSDHCTDQDLKPIKFRRSINDNSNPAETINFQAKYLILLKDAISQSKKIQTEITDYDGVTSFTPSNIAVSGNNSICQDLCTDSNLITGRLRDGAGFCGSGTSHTCPSDAYNNQSLDCGGLSYTCNSTWGSTGSSSGTSSSINCTSTPVCSDICTASANSCAVNGGSRACNYTTYLGSTNCIAAAAPSQSCTATCSATSMCVNGGCTTVICNATPVCSDICIAPANSCTTNGGTKTCNYTTYLGSTNCIAAAAPTQPCTQDTCTISNGSQFCSSAICTACNSGLLTNGCFENSTTPSSGWTSGGAVSGTAVIDETVSHSGRNSYKVTNTGYRWGWQITQGSISTTAGETFCLSGWVKKGYFNSWTPIAVQEVGGSGRSMEFNTPNGLGWQKIKQSVTIPANWQRNIQVYARSYGLDTNWFDDLSLVSGACGAPPATQSTQITDNFERLDNSFSLGNADSGQTWHAERGIWGIINKQAYLVSPEGVDDAVIIDGGSINGTMQAKLAINPQDSRLVFRYLDINNHYIAERDGSGYRFDRVKGGIKTNFGSWGGIPQNGDVIRVVMSGNTMTIFINDIQSFTFDDASIQGTKYGIGTYANANVRFDNFSFVP